MSAPEDENPGSQRDDEQVGSVAEEAAKLFAALNDWARDSGGEYADAAASAFDTVNEHIATGGQDCRYCPVCQVIALARRTSPEVRQHLAAAGSSLVQAVTAAMATAAPPPRQRRDDVPVERIDLTDDWEDD